jgi:hypothetical protein
MYECTRSSVERGAAKQRLVGRDWTLWPVFASYKGNRERRAAHHKPKPMTKLVFQSRMTGQGERIPRLAQQMTQLRGRLWSKNIKIKYY